MRTPSGSLPGRRRVRGGLGLSTGRRSEVACLDEDALPCVTWRVRQAGHSAPPSEVSMLPEERRVASEGMFETEFHQRDPTFLYGGCVPPAANRVVCFWPSPTFRDPRLWETLRAWKTSKKHEESVRPPRGCLRRSSCSNRNAGGFLEAPMIEGISWEEFENLNGMRGGGLEARSWRHLFVFFSLEC